MIYHLHILFELVLYAVVARSTNPCNGSDPTDPLRPESLLIQRGKNSQTQGRRRLHSLLFHLFSHRLSLTLSSSTSLASHSLNSSTIISIDQLEDKTSIFGRGGGVGNSFELKKSLLPNLSPDAGLFPQPSPYIFLFRIVDGDSSASAALTSIQLHNQDLPCPDTFPVNVSDKIVHTNGNVIL